MRHLFEKYPLVRILKKKYLTEMLILIAETLIWQCTFANIFQTHKNEKARLLLTKFQNEI